MKHGRVSRLQLDRCMQQWRDHPAMPRAEHRRFAAIKVGHRKRDALVFALRPPLTNVRF